VGEEKQQASLPSVTESKSLLVVQHRKPPNFSKQKTRAGGRALASFYRVKGLFLGVDTGFILGVCVPYSPFFGRNLTKTPVQEDALGKRKRGPLMQTK